MTSAEWKKYNNLVTSDNQSALRISNNAFLVEGEKENSNYKLVIFDDSFEEKPITAVYGIGDNTFHQDITSFDAKYIADIIYETEQLKYVDKKIIKRILRNVSDSY